MLRMQEAKAKKPAGKAEDAKSQSQKSRQRETGSAEDAKSQSRKSRLNPIKSSKKPNRGEL